MDTPIAIARINHSPGSAPLSRWERYGLVVLLLTALVFGGLVELRSAFLKRRMGDLDVFLRAAWAVRAGEDVYQVSDDNRFHYHYPTLFAILIAPLADAPAGADRAGMLPYPITVVLWYLLSVLFLAIAVHGLASALEQVSPDPEVQRQPRGCRRWWALRVMPVLACLSPIGHTLMRGQVNLLLLLLLCGMIAAVLRGRRWQAGFWLAGAICLKVIPGFLLLYPLWKRDGRCLAGCALGLLVGLGIIPLAVFGPQQTFAYYSEWTTVLVKPGLGAGDDPSRARELIDVTATDSQSFQAIFHNTLYPDVTTRPRTAGLPVRLAHWFAGGLLTLLTLAAARGRTDGRGQVLLLGCLILIMILLSPVCHLHYFCLLVPLVMSLLDGRWQGQFGVLPGKGLGLLLMVLVIANILPHLEMFQMLRDDGIATYAALLVWGAGVLALRTRRSETVLPLALAA